MTTRRGSVRHDIQLNCPPGDVWKLVGDPARVHEWFPGIVSCTVEGDVRTVITRSGLPMPEQLLTVDPVLRRIEYRITAPLFKEHLGTLDVHALDDGSSLVVYSTDADPAALALVIGGAARAALGQLPVALGLRDGGDAAGAHSAGPNSAGVHSGAMDPAVGDPGPAGRTEGGR
jgi:hypothetical protein